jgi:phosphoglycolate phosphatase
LIRPPAALVFDLDGTLLDSRRDLATAVNRVRSSYGLEPLALAEVLALVGEGARNLVARALGLDPETAEASETARLDEALARFFGHYEEVCLDTTRPYPGIPEALRALAPRYPMALCTNKPERFTRLLLDRLDLARHLPHLVAGDTLPTRKPDPAGMRLLAERMGVSLAEAMLVGDSRVDAATAAAAGCRFALVTWGFAGEGEEARIREAREPEIVAADAAGLLRALQVLQAPLAR